MISSSQPYAYYFLFHLHITVAKIVATYTSTPTLSNQLRSHGLDITILTLLILDRGKPPNPTKSRPQ